MYVDPNTRGICAMCMGGTNRNDIGTIYMYLTYDGYMYPNIR